MMNKKSNSVKICKGKGGWGGPLVITPDTKKKYVISVTGGGIHPLAQRIADLTGTTAVDSFKNPVEKDETLCAVIDCGGTARCGTYPRLSIPTINVKVQQPSGPLAKFMTEDIFVSATTLGDVEILGGATLEINSGGASHTEVQSTPEKLKAEAKEKVRVQNDDSDSLPSGNGLIRFIEKIGRIAGSFINIMYQAGRETIETILKNILPFMAFVATLIGIINFTGIGDVIATGLTPLAGSLVGLIILGFITSLPFLSPLLAPGAVIASIIGILIGNELAQGSIPPNYALPALFAINSQVGCDFAPVGMTLGEAEPSTISNGVPAVLFSRLITGPLAVAVAYVMSFGL